MIDQSNNTKPTIGFIQSLVRQEAMRNVFGLVASTTSGLLLGKFLDNVTKDGVLLWFSIGSMCVTSLVALYAHFEKLQFVTKHSQLFKEFENYKEQIAYESRKNNEQKQNSKLVLFLAPSSGTFYADYYKNLVCTANRQADVSQQMIIAALWPEGSDHVTNSPEKSLELVKKYPMFNGLFIIPSDPDDSNNQKQLLELVQHFEKKVVILDVYPGHQSDGKFPCFVGADELKGGRRAGQIAKEFFTRRNRTLKRIYILQGRKTTYERQRVNGFIDFIRENFINGDCPLIVESKPLDYDARKAKELLYNISEDIESLNDEITRVFRQRVTGDKPAVDFSVNSLLDFDLFYACNDEMALAAREVIIDLLERESSDVSYRKSYHPVVIGYDGIEGVINLVNSKDPFIIGTIQTSPEKQAQRAVGIMAELLKNNSIQEFYTEDPVKRQNI